MIKKISSGDLKVGMFVSDINTPWQYHPFIRNSKLIKSDRDIEKFLKFNIGEVYIDTNRGKDSRYSQSAKEESRKFRKEIHRNLSNNPAYESDSDGNGRKEIPFEEAENSFNESLKNLTESFQNINSEGLVNIEKITETASSLVNLVSEDLNSAFIMTKIKTTDEYTFRHSLNVALLSVALGKKLGFSKSELKVLGTGALLHDCGVLMIPPKILNKPKKLTEEEFNNIKKHPLYGFEMLEKIEGIPRKSILIALQHHEKYSGIGYPDGLPGYRISSYAMMVSIADIYDALCTDKPYRKSLPPYIALQKIYGWKGTQLNPKLVDYFIKTVGIYPVGSVLKFKNGFTGIVKRVKKENLLSPETIVVLDCNGQLLQKPFFVNVEKGIEDKLESWEVDEVADASLLNLNILDFLK